MVNILLKLIPSKIEKKQISRGRRFSQFKTGELGELLNSPE